MKRTCAAALAVAAIVGWAALIPAHAAPPTVTPSPGYDARLQEQRAASKTADAPVARPPHRRHGKRILAH